MTTKRAEPRRRAFTLIELLVVIAVIAVLMAILMPALSRAREQGKRAVCLSNVKQFGLAWVMYADENDQLIVNSCTVENTEGHPNPSNKKEPCWLNFHQDWTDVERRIQGIQDGAMWPYVGQLKIYKCPTGIRGEVNTYAIVDAMNGPIGNTRIGAPNELIIRRRSQIKRPGERMVFVDEGKTSTQSWTIFYNVPSWWDAPPVRHGDGTNFSFADGHAEYWKWRDARTGKHANGAAEYKALPDNPDIQRVQRAAWGKLGYEP